VGKNWRIFNVKAQGVCSYHSTTKGLITCPVCTLACHTRDLRQQSNSSYKQNPSLFLLGLWRDFYEFPPILSWIHSFHLFPLPHFLLWYISYFTMRVIVITYRPIYRFCGLVDYQTFYQYLDAFISSIGAPTRSNISNIFQEVWISLYVTEFHGT
jgi:hypothetical protein